MCCSGEIVVPRPKILKKLSKNMAKKLSKSCQKVAKSGQKVVKKLQKVVKKLTKNVKKVQNSTNSGGGWGVWGEIVFPRPSASALLTGQRQKWSTRQVTQMKSRRALISNISSK
jgi:DNA anti-recombination protein RmuC